MHYQHVYQNKHITCMLLLYPSRQERVPPCMCALPFTSIFRFGIETVLTVWHICFYFIILLESRTLSRCISEKRSNRHTRHFVLKWLFRCRERESLCICMLRVSFLPLSTMFRLYNGTVSTVWDFLCFIYLFGGGGGVEGSFKELLSKFLHCISACK